MKANARFYAVLGLLLVIVVMWRWSTSNYYDFSMIAKGRVQLASGLRSESCKEIPDDVAAAAAVRLSVIVSTEASEEAVITQTINSIIAYTDPSLLEEVIIATDKSMTEEHRQLLLNEFAHYRPIIHIADGHAENRLKNKLVVGHLARGNIVVFIDDTVVVSDGYLLPLIGVLKQHPEVSTWDNNYSLLITGQRPILSRG